MRKVLVFVVLLAFAAFGQKSIRVAPDGTGTTAQGASWAQAMGIDTLIAYMAGSTAGDTIFWKGGVYDTVAGWDFSTKAGTNTQPYLHYGVKSSTTNEIPTASDAAIDSSDMPRITTTESLKTGSRHIYINMSFFQSGDFTYMISAAGGYNTYFENCYFVGSATSAEMYIVANADLLNCVVHSLQSIGVLNTGQRTIKTRIHNTNRLSLTNAGIAVTSSSSRAIISDVIIDNFNIGINNNSDDVFINSAVITNCNTGISNGSGRAWVLNTIIDSSKVYGIKATTENRCTPLQGNHIDVTRNNDSSYVNTPIPNTLFGDNYHTTGDPLFVDPANKDFRLQSGSPCINSGIGVK